MSSVSSFSVHKSSPSKPDHALFVTQSTKLCVLGLSSLTLRIISSAQQSVLILSQQSCEPSNPSSETRRKPKCKNYAANSPTQSLPVLVAEATPLECSILSAKTPA